MNRPDFTKLVAAELAVMERDEDRFVSSLDALAHLDEEADRYWEQVKRRKEADRTVLLNSLVRLAALAQRTVRETSILFNDFRRLSEQAFERSRSDIKARRYGSLHESAAVIRSVINVFAYDVESTDGAKTIDLMLLLATASRAIATDLGILDAVAATTEATPS